MSFLRRLFFHPPPLLRRIHTSSTRIQLRPPPSPAHQQSLDRISHVLHLLESHSHVSTAQTQLAMRGLQQVDAAVRIGVIGRNSAPLLTALLHPPPPIATDLNIWLTTHRSNPTAGLLLRYGPTTQLPSASTDTSGGISTLTVPIDLLRVHSLELLIIPGAKQVTTNPVFFLPNGRVVEVPVHKAVEYLGEGEEGLRALMGVRDEGRETVMRVVSVRGGGGEETGEVRVVGGLEEGVREWVLSGTRGVEGVWVKPAVGAFVRDLLRRAERELEGSLPSPSQLQSQSRSSPAAAAVSTVSPASRPAKNKATEQIIASAITSFTTHAHHTLPTDLGFTARLWHTLDWWKLLWRVDDVTHITRSIILEHFLRDIERDAIFLGGRLFSLVSPSIPPSSSSPSPESESESSSSPPAMEEYIPRTISHERDSIAQALIPTLQLSAQKSVLRFLEISSASIGAGFLTAFAGMDLLLSGGVMGAGVAAAVVGLRKKWKGEMGRFEAEVGERGRRVVDGVERWAWGLGRRGVVEEGVREEGRVRERRELRGLVREALGALEVVAGGAETEKVQGEVKK
ncbi:hypothetical protein EX30DRAFT_398694 [Ascodesmis nigricans]|uniref:Mmc1 C-terminal domain-containing protein n=1 Tax=Ascodesmis nigricans TaxID=341454 RepID=A0A4S2MPG0_9PEZI|nr:hypothetical protein EX30DRAFT_398694 [Ascodesmis nigricans]